MEEKGIKVTIELVTPIGKLNANGSAAKRMHSFFP